MSEGELARMVGDLRNSQTVLPENFGVWPTKQDAFEAPNEHQHRSVPGGG